MTHAWTGTGIPWRCLPHDYPPWQTTYAYFRDWQKDGIFEQLGGLLRRAVRTAAGRNPEPSACIIDAGGGVSSRTPKASRPPPTSRPPARAATPARRSPAASAASSPTPSDSSSPSWSSPPASPTAPTAPPSSTAPPASGSTSKSSRATPPPGDSPHYHAAGRPSAPSAG
ncbi:transposase [Nonomuraea wenchangensis]|uniref:transposase n=1 Tax=Nonomuraea wenchangensis TaxID=568860 RepID=UPI0034370C8F